MPGRMRPLFIPWALDDRQSRILRETRIGSRPLAQIKSRPAIGPHSPHVPAVSAQADPILPRFCLVALRHTSRIASLAARTPPERLRLSKNVSEEADAERVWNLVGSGVKDLGHGGR